MDALQIPRPTSWATASGRGLRPSGRPTRGSVDRVVISIPPASACGRGTSVHGQGHGLPGRSALAGACPSAELSPRPPSVSSTMTLGSPTNGSTNTWRPSSAPAPWRRLDPSYLASGRTIRGRSRLHPGEDSRGVGPVRSLVAESHADRFVAESKARTRWFWIRDTCPGRKPAEVARLIGDFLSHDRPPRLSSLSRLRWGCPRVRRRKVST
jgi:hypothetical protein